jgi:membrane associated rhomboid family serine protease
MALRPNPVTTTGPGREPGQLSKAVAVNGGTVGIMWVLELIDQMTRNSLDRFGIQPRDVDGLGDILLAPWLHFGWGHLISNSIPFLVLGILIYLSGVGRWLVTVLVTAVVSGITVWLISPPNSLTLGASGIVFGFLTYLLVRGFFTRKLSQIVIAVVVMLLYGGVLWGIFPTSAGVSWQGHLGGAVGGVLSAWLMHSRRDRPIRRRAQYEA